MERGGVARRRDTNPGLLSKNRPTWLEVVPADTGPLVAPYLPRAHEEGTIAFS